MNESEETKRTNAVQFYLNDTDYAALSKAAAESKRSRANFAEYSTMEAVKQTLQKGNAK